MRRLINAVAAALVLVSIVGHTSKADVVGEIEAELKAAVIDRRDYPFLAVHVETAAGEVVVSSAVANPQFFAASAGPEINDWMRIWSMSKLVTIVLALDLVESGALALDDKAATYIPELSGMRVARSSSGGSLPQLSQASYELTSNDSHASGPCDYLLESPGRPMTVHDLMIHSAGFYYATTNLPCLDRPLAKLELPLAHSTDEWLAGITRLPLIQSPDEGYYYGLNTTVLGFVLERATGKSLQTLLEERLLNPYGIEGLSFILPQRATLPPRVSGADGILRLAKPMELDIFGGHQPPYGSDTTLFLGGEGLVATAPGFAKLLRVVFFSQETGVPPVLEPQSIAAMTRPQTNADSGWGAMGYGLWLSNGRRPDGTYGRDNIWTGGGYEGTQYWIDPIKRQVGVMMTQVFMPPTSGLSMDNKVRDILDASD